MASKRKTAHLKRCQWHLANGTQCENYFEGDGDFCHSHRPGGGGGIPTAPKPPDNPGNGPAWVSAISGLIGVATPIVIAVWPHIAPWFGMHLHYFSQMGKLLDDVIATGEDGPDEASHLDFVARYQTLVDDFNHLNEMAKKLQEKPLLQRKLEVFARQVEGLRGAHVIGMYDLVTGKFTQYSSPKKVRVESVKK